MITTVKILVDGGRVDAQAVAVVGVWAAVKQEKSTGQAKGYSITHLPSGMRALSCGSAELARRVIKNLPQVGADGWDAGRDAPRVLEACARMGIRASGHNEFSYGECT